MADAWHSKKTEQVLSELKVDQQGLKSDEAKRRLEEFGYNELKEKKKVTPFQIFIGQFRDIGFGHVLEAQCHFVVLHLLSFCCVSFPRRGIVSFFGQML